MYSTHCEDPSCLNCRQTLEDQNSEKKPDHILLTVKGLLLLASNKKAFCIEACRKIKDDISDRISSLINVLKERERDLYTQVDQECYIQMAKIDNDVTTHYVDNLIKTSDESEKDLSINEMVFKCEFDSIFWELKKFGQLSYEDPVKFVRHSQEQKFERTSRVGVSTIPLSCPVKNEKLENFIKSSKDEDEQFENHTGSISNKEFKKDNSLDENLTQSPKDKKQHLEESTEVEKNSSSDEDDMEIISKNEAADIPDEFLFTPRKNRSIFSKKRSFFPSLLSKKPLIMPTDSVSKHLICNENKSAFIHEERKKFPYEESLNPPLNEQVSGVITRSDSKVIKRNSSALMSMAERKEQSIQDSSSKNYDNSDGACHDPSMTLLSSFKKYLEKTPEREWLAPEQLLHPGNSCIFSRNMPFLTENVDQWLFKKNNQKVFSD